MGLSSDGGSLAYSDASGQLVVYPFVSTGSVYCPVASPTYIYQECTDSVSSRVIVAIVVSFVVVLLFCLIAIICLWRKRDKRAEEEGKDSGGNMERVGDVSSLNQTNTTLLNGSHNGSQIIKVREDFCDKAVIVEDVIGDEGIEGELKMKRMRKKKKRDLIKADPKSIIIGLSRHTIKVEELEVAADMEGVGEKEELEGKAEDGKEGEYDE